MLLLLDILVVMSLQNIVLVEELRSVLSLFWSWEMKSGTLMNSFLIPTEIVLLTVLGKITLLSVSVWKSEVHFENQISELYVVKILRGMGQFVEILHQLPLTKCV